MLGQTLAHDGMCAIHRTYRIFYADSGSPNMIFKELLRPCRELLSLETQSRHGNGFYFLRSPW